MSIIKKEIIGKAKTICQKCFRRPHLRAIWWIVLAFLISGFLSIVIFQPCQAMSAILASICAGCVTGIAFYVITNLRNNEIQATNEEFKTIEEKIALARKAQHLCVSILESIEGNKEYRSELSDLKECTDKLIVYMGTMFIDSPKTTKLIKDFPVDYPQKAESLSAAFEYLEAKNEESDNKELQKKEAISCLYTILTFCADTKDILLEPMIELMKDICLLEKSVL